MKENKYDADGSLLELGDDFFKNAKTGAGLAETNPAIAKLIEAQKDGVLAVRPVGRPVSDNPKQSTTVRLDSQVLDFFKAGGKGWQTRINAVLREHVKKAQS
ncbi:MAG: hypothetical protein CR978_02190 [Gammaproteobacteria bacterium]|nr:MAG: hypothetical protein CR978_02190 [Gammaproteobacteria bacterium]